MTNKIKIGRALVKLERSRQTLLEYLQTNGIHFLNSPSHEELIKRVYVFIGKSEPIKRIQTINQCSSRYGYLFNDLGIKRNVLTPSQLKDSQELASHGRQILGCIGIVDLGSVESIVITPKKKSKDKKVPISSKPKQQKTPARTEIDRKIRAFYKSYEWRQLRYMMLTVFGPKCRCCGKTPDAKIVINMDHIQPIRRFWDLRLDPNNIQVMCNECNHGKSNWDSTDWRTDSDKKLAKQVARAQSRKISLA